MRTCPLLDERETGVLALILKRDFSAARQQIVEIRSGILSGELGCHMEPARRAEFSGVVCEALDLAVLCGELQLVSEFLRVKDYAGASAILGGEGEQESK